MTESVSGERAPLDPTLGLGDFLAGAQVLNNISQTELAKKIGVSQQSVSRWLNGKSRPRRHTMRILANLFELTELEAMQLTLNNRPRTIDKAVRHMRTPRTGLEVITTPETQTLSVVENYTEKLIGAFAVRAEQGPPLSQPETDLVRFLMTQLTSGIEQVPVAPQD